jgi:hypothetical protein
VLLGPGQHPTDQVWGPRPHSTVQQGQAILYTYGANTHRQEWFKQQLEEQCQGL